MTWSGGTRQVVDRLPRKVMRPERPGPNLRPFVPGSSRCAPQAMLGRSECDAASMKAEDQQEAWRQLRVHRPRGGAHACCDRR